MPGCRSKALARLGQRVKSTLFPWVVSLYKTSAVQSRIKTGPWPTNKSMLHHANAPLVALRVASLQSVLRGTSWKTGNHHLHFWLLLFPPIYLNNVASLGCHHPLRILHSSEKTQGHRYGPTSGKVSIML